MQAVILAGGKGTRLKPYTTVLPKPLMPIGDVPIIEILLRQLKAAGVDNVILAVGYMSQLFQAFLGEGERYGLKISYSFEEKALGTAGPLSLITDQLEDDFLVMNGDLLTTIDFKSLYANHLEKQAAATIATFQRTVNIDFGVIEFDEHSCLSGYREKPSFHFDVSMGINVLNRNKIKKTLVRDQYFDIPDLMKKLKSNEERVLCLKQECEWLDIGRIDDYQMAIEVFEDNRSKFLPDLK